VLAGPHRAPELEASAVQRRFWPELAEVWLLPGRAESVALLALRLGLAGPLERAEPGLLVGPRTSRLASVARLRPMGLAVLVVPSMSWVLPVGSRQQGPAVLVRPSPSLPGPVEPLPGQARLGPVATSS